MEKGQTVKDLWYAQLLPQFGEEIPYDKVSADTSAVAMAKTIRRILHILIPNLKNSLAG